MCRNIKTLFNFEPPATDDEVRAASLQFVRKLSGFTAPSKANEAVFMQAIDDIAVVARAGRVGLRLVGPPDRDAVLDRLDLAERVRIETGTFVEVDAPAALRDDLAAGLVSGRVDRVTCTGERS